MIKGKVVAAIAKGAMVLVAVEKHDTIATAERLAQRILNYRVFTDENGKMNLDLVAVGGGLMLVPQFTLAADTGKGNRPSFADVADRDTAASLFNHVVQVSEDSPVQVVAGIFGADMQVQLVNDGPVTFIVRA